VSLRIWPQINSSMATSSSALGSVATTRFGAGAAHRLNNSCLAGATPLRSAHWSRPHSGCAWLGLKSGGSLSRAIQRHGSESSGQPEGQVGQHQLSAPASTDQAVAPDSLKSRALQATMQELPGCVSKTDSAHRGKQSGEEVARAERAVRAAFPNRRRQLLNERPKV
jgi:hypothetical protein